MHKNIYDVAPAAAEDVEAAEGFFAIRWAYRRLNKRLPQRNVKMAIGMSRRNVWNIFNFNQKTVNNTRIPPKPRWKPIVLGWKVKLPMLMPNFDQKINNNTKGVKHKPVKTSETMREGRLSGTRNWCLISGKGERTGCFLASVKNKLNYDYLISCITQKINIPPWLAFAGNLISMSATSHWNELEIEESPTIK